MCRTDNFCGLLSLRGGAYVAVFLSMIRWMPKLCGNGRITDHHSMFQIYGFFLLVFAIFNVHLGVDKEEYFRIVRGFILVCLIILFAVGTISLAFSTLTDKSGLTIIWLTTAMAFIVFNLLDTLFVVYEVLKSPVTNENIPSFVEAGLVVCFDAFLLYLWIVVLNFYWELKQKKREEEAIKA